MNNKNLKTVSEELGYSMGTISRAINNRKGVSQKTRNEILDALDRIGYQPNKIAQSLVKKTSHLIGVIVPDFANDFLGSIVTVIERVLEDKGYHMLLFSTNWSIETERKKIQLALYNQVDGLLIKPISEKAKHLKSIPVPTVFISQTFSGNANWVDIENKKAAFEAVSYLFRCGYQKIAFVGSNIPNIIYRLRCEGYQEALRSQNNTYELIDSCEHSIQAGYEIMTKFLSSANPPDAVFCCDDYMGVGILTCAQDRNISVPDEFGIIGFNDTNVSRIPQISLTTISQPIQSIGQYSVQMLLQEIESDEIIGSQKIILSSSLVSRTTTRKPLSEAK